MAKKQYIIYCDESSKKGKYFSNFYGGALIRAQDRQSIENALRAKKDSLNLFQELKWTKVTEAYLSKYIDFINFYFDFVRSGRIKVRVMFTQNMFRPVGLSSEQIDVGYFLLYYQLIKHGFGLQYCNPMGLDKIFFQLYFDELPDKKEKCDFFKDRLSEIPNLRDFRSSNIEIPRDSISEIKSDQHIILQGLDIILGSVHFRLNDLHRVKPEGSRFRGKRTVAKEKLYKVISQQIRDIYPGFNIGVSTGCKSIEDRWKHEYRHWVFKPSSYNIDLEAGKPR